MGDIKKVKVDNASYNSSQNINKTLFNNERVKRFNQTSKTEEYDMNSKSSIEDIKNLLHIDNGDGTYSVKGEYSGYEAIYTFNQDGSYNIKYVTSNGADSINVYLEFDKSGNKIKSVYDSSDLNTISFIGKDGKNYASNFISTRDIGDGFKIISKDDYQACLNYMNSDVVKKFNVSKEDLLAAFYAVDQDVKDNLSTAEKIEMAAYFAGNKNNNSFIANIKKQIYVHDNDKQLTSLSGIKADVIGTDKDGKPILYSYDSFENVSGKGVYTTQKDIENIKQYSGSFKDMDSQQLAAYVKRVDDLYGNSISKEKKIDVIKDLAENDKKNHYKILCSTPSLKIGKVDYQLHGVGYVTYDGEYLEYFSENGKSVKSLLTTINVDDKGNVSTKDLLGEDRNRFIRDTTDSYLKMMEVQNNKYSENFRKLTSLFLNSIVFVDTDYDHPDWTAYVNDNGSVRSDMVIDVDSSKSDIEGVYTHELGHVFGNLSDLFFSEDVHSSKQWEDIYNQINNIDKDNKLLRDYAHTSPIECFAECVAEYYSDGNNSYNYNSNDLKMIDITVDGKKMTLYDYIADTIDRKRELV